MANNSDPRLDTSQISEWRSIFTLIVFLVTSEYRLHPGHKVSLIPLPRSLIANIIARTDIIAIFPFHISIPVWRPLRNAFLGTLVRLRIISSRKRDRHVHRQLSNHDGNNQSSLFVWPRFPMNFITAPVIAVLFLLAIGAIGRDEVVQGTYGAENIYPYDIMIFFITLAYIAISIDASGLIRYLAFVVLEKGKGSGRKLFFYLYAFFFSIGSFIGNDPIILSGTAFLAYMTRVSENIKHPRAWIYSQFAMANISSAILVSSNPTNLVLAGAFNIKFINYTAHMIVPVVVTAIVLFPFLMFYVFNNKNFIPTKIKLRELPDTLKSRARVNPNIPNARGMAEVVENQEGSKALSLEMILNPFVDKKSAAFGAIVMSLTLISVLVLNAVSIGGSHFQVFLVTAPAAGLMLVWDIGYGWLHRHQTRQQAEAGRQEVRRYQQEQRSGGAMLVGTGQDRPALEQTSAESVTRTPRHSMRVSQDGQTTPTESDHGGVGSERQIPGVHGREPVTIPEKPESPITETSDDNSRSREDVSPFTKLESSGAEGNLDMAARKGNPASAGRPPVGIELMQIKGTKGDDQGLPNLVSDEDAQVQAAHPGNTLTSVTKNAWSWTQETFPTFAAVLTHLPLALIPFAFAMFILVQGLVTKGWVPIFAIGWDRWVSRTGVIGCIGGMGFVSVILCNVSVTLWPPVLSFKRC